jgi:tripartite-type tricarboxylate transporter receptor subunit TctC
VMFDNMSSAIPNINAGKVRALGVASLKRYPALPDMPTIHESGVKGYETTIWLALFAPAATPKATVERLNAELRKAVDSTEYKARLQTLYMQPVTSTPQQLSGWLKAELGKWNKVVKEAGIKPE